MSDFECINGHSMLPSWGPLCRICGMPVHTVDGKTARELEWEDRMDDARDIAEESEPDDECTDSL